VDKLTLLLPVTRPATIKVFRPAAEMLGRRAEHVGRGAAHPGHHVVVDIRDGAADLLFDAGSNFLDLFIESSTKAFETARTGRGGLLHGGLTSLHYSSCAGLHHGVNGRRCRGAGPVTFGSAGQHALIQAAPLPAAGLTGPWAMHASAGIARVSFTASPLHGHGVLRRRFYTDDRTAGCRS
jgi:hypothetical protein